MAKRPHTGSKLEPIEARFTPAQALDANALELFARVVEAGSFAAAARKLGQTRAAVSRRIAAIEAQVGQPLLARTTRSLGLTETGRRLAQRARAVFDAAEAARGALRASRAGLAGRLRITTAPSVGRHLLAPLLAEFRAQHPGVSYELLFTLRRVDLLREGVDIAFRMTREPPQDWVAKPLLRLRVSAYARPDRWTPLAQPRELEALPLLLLQAARETPPRLRWMSRDASAPAQTAVAQQVAAYGDDIDSLVALACAGAGVVLALEHDVQHLVAAGELVDLLPAWQLPVPEAEWLQALTLPQPLVPEAAQALVRFVALRLAAPAVG
jgi:DNA-binding transcriptional LysR family regulator